MDVRIFCEGESDKDFLKSFLIFLVKNGKIKLENPESIIEAKKNKPSLLNVNSYDFKKLKKVKRVLFVFDCDFEENDNKCGGCQKSISCIKEVIKEFEKHDIEADYFLFDNNLEAFLLETIDEKSAECFSDFKRCLSLEDVSRHQKMLVCMYKNLKDNFDYSHVNFNALKEKIVWLLKE